MPLRFICRYADAAHEPHCCQLPLIAVPDRAADSRRRRLIQRRCATLPPRRRAASQPLPPLFSPASDAILSAISPPPMAAADDIVIFAACHVFSPRRLLRFRLLILPFAFSPCWPAS
jgi:hypothetical protein